MSVALQINSPTKHREDLVLVFHFKNGGYLALTFSSFLMKLFLLPIERNNYFGSVSVVCRSCCSKWFQLKEITISVACQNTCR